MRKRTPLLAGALACLLFLGGQQASATAKGKIFVSPTGSDAGGNCQRFTTAQVFPTNRATVCLTLGKAYSLASPGDRIIMGNGTYGDQRICRGTVQPTCGLTGDKGPPVITIQSETRHGARIVGLLEMGRPSTSKSSPSYITIDGVDVNGWINNRQASDTGGLVHQVTFQNMHIWDMASNGTGAEPAGDGIVNWYDGNTVGLTYNNVEVGPVCCASDAFENGMSPPTANVTVNYTIENSQIHDVYDTCTAVPATVTAEWGSCTGLGAGDGACSCTSIHVDGYQMWAGVRNMKFINNRFYAIGTTGNYAGQGIIMTCSDVTGTSFPYVCTNITLDHNVFIHGSVDNYNVNLNTTGAGALGIQGRVSITNNTMVETETSGDPGSFRIGANASNNGLAATATVYVAHNVMSLWQYTSGSDCVAYRVNTTTMIPTFVGNYFANTDCS